MSDNSVSSAFWELLDDIGDYYDVATRQSIGEANQMAKEKLFGLDAPKIDKSTIVAHGDGYQTSLSAPGITDFQQYGSGDKHTFGKIVDPEAFVWGGGVKGVELPKHSKENMTRDIAFAGRPGEIKNGKWVDIDLSAKKYNVNKGLHFDPETNTLYEKGRKTSKDDLKWMVPGKDGRGLRLVSGDEKPKDGLTKILKIYDVKEDLKAFNEGKKRHEKLKGSKFYEANYSAEEIEAFDEFYKEFNSFTVKSEALFKGHDTYNLALAKDGKIKAIFKLNALGFVNHRQASFTEEIKEASQETGPRIMHDAVIDALLSFDADEVFYLDAGMNKDWQIGRDWHGSFEYGSTSTIGGVHIGYE